MEAKDVGGELKVGPIRDLRSDAFIRPNEARSKVYLIENAQNMNPNAQNALLKVLEEGPPYAAFLLMTDRAGALLETIRSRCAAIHVGEDDNGDETDAQALAFAQLLVSGDEFQRADFLVRFENTKPDRPTQEHFLNGLEELLNENFPDVVVAPFLLTAGTDARRLTDVADNILRFAPIDLDKEQFASIHGEDEHIRVSNIGQCVCFYKDFIKRLRREEP